MDDAVLTPDLILNAYAGGAFPMAEHQGADAAIHFYRPVRRTLFTVESLHIPARLRRWLRTTPLVTRFPDDVHTIMRHCGERRGESWINPVLLEMYGELAAHGFAQALGVYDGDELAGGIYWVRLGSAVMAESMFSRRPNASKLALMTLLAAVRARQARLELAADRNWVDVQYTNPHLEQFNPVQVTLKRYQSWLDGAVSAGALADGFSASDFSATSLADFLQFKTQIS